MTKALASFGDVMTEEEMEKIFREAGININNPEEEVDYMKFINFWIGDNDEWNWYIILQNYQNYFLINTIFPYINHLLYTK